MNLRELFSEGKRKLSENRVPDAENDARLLLLDAFGSLQTGVELVQAAID